MSSKDTKPLTILVEVTSLPTTQEAIHSTLLVSLFMQPTQNTPKLTSQIINKMSHNNILLYEGDEYPKTHWFVCKKFWDALDITGKDKQMTQFTGALRKRSLTRFMNFTENQTTTKGEIKSNFLSFFKTQGIKHLET
jgi:hypothetical protein